MEQNNTSLQSQEWLNSLGRRIRAKREDKGWSQADLAAKLDLSQQAISELENNQAGNITLQRLVQVANALGTEVRDLLENSIFINGNTNNGSQTVLGGTIHTHGDINEKYIAHLEEEISYLRGIIKEISSK